MAPDSAEPKPRQEKPPRPPLALATQALTALTFFAALLSAAPGFGESAWIESLSITSESITGYDDPTVFSQTLDGGCRPEPGSAKVNNRPLAGPAVLPLRVEAKIVTCPDSEHEPPLHCRYTLGGESGERRSLPLRKNVPIPMPKKVGRHELSLSCSAGDGPYTPESRHVVYVTQGRPLPSMQPAEERWYDLAVSWGDGAHGVPFGLGGSKSLLRKLTEGIYDYGQRHWRYGYGSLQDDGSYTFNNEPALTAEQAETYGMDGGNTCPWDAMIEKNTACNFADCYIFSDLLHQIASLHGVVGIHEVILTGKEKQGFATHHGSASLDPNFPANSLCSESLECPPYVFYTHSVQQHGSVIYDPTFGEIYRTRQQAVGTNILKWDEKESKDYSILLEDQSRLCVMPSGGPNGGYGNWMFYYNLGPTTQQNICPNDPDKPVEFTGKFQFSQPGSDVQGPFKSLEVSLQIYAETESKYGLGLILASEVQEITHRSSFEDSRPSMRAIALQAGKQWVQASFSGEDIYRSGVDEPCKIIARLVTDKGVSDTLEIETPVIHSASFGEIGGLVTRVQVNAEPNSDGNLLEGLDAQTSLLIRSNGDYLLQGTLSQDGKRISVASLQQTFDIGDVEVKLSFPGEEISGKGLDAPYDLIVELLDNHRQLLASEKVEVDGYQASQFVGAEGSTDVSDEGASNTSK